MSHCHWARAAQARREKVSKTEKIAQAEVASARILLHLDTTRGLGDCSVASSDLIDLSVNGRLLT